METKYKYIQLFSWRSTIKTILVLDLHYLVQALYSTTDQSESGTACHFTRSANHRRHSVVI